MEPMEEDAPSKIDGGNVGGHEANNKDEIGNGKGTEEVAGNCASDHHGVADTTDSHASVATPQVRAIKVEAGSHTTTNEQQVQTSKPDTTNGEHQSADATGDAGGQAKQGPDTGEKGKVGSPFGDATVPIPEKGEAAVQMQAPATVAVKVEPAAAAAAVKVESSGGHPVETKSSKKRPAKPMKKVYVAKKERELAASFFAGKRDLADILESKDCFFLARTFWVFSHAQLEFIVKRGLGETSPDVSENSSYTKEKIISALMDSDILDFEKTGNAMLIDTKVSESTDANPAPMEIDEPAKSETLQDEKTKDQSANTDGVEENKGSLSNEPAKDANMETDQPNAAATTTNEAEPGEEGDSDGTKAIPSDNNKVAQEALEAAVVEEAMKVTEVPVGPEEKRAAAEAKLRKWAQRLEGAQRLVCPPMKDMFSLEGAVSVILTNTTRNFLETVDIDKLYTFLSLKKTETGAICDVFLNWRAKCGLPNVSNLGVAKYLLGVNARLEEAIASIPPVDESRRGWMMDPIIVMTGAAREFLVEDQKLMSCFDFIHTRTKDLSLALAAWRERRGFVPLKGSGKVAMISGWKATAKEVLEVEAGAGQKLDDVEFKNIPFLDANAQATIAVAPPPEKKPKSAPPAPKAAGPKKKEEVPKPPVVAEVISPIVATVKLGTRAAKKRGRRSDYDLHSKLFMEQVVGEEETDVLGTASIHTAAQLFEANAETKESLIDELVEIQMATNPAEAKKMVERWISELRSQLNIKEATMDEYVPSEVTSKPITSATPKRSRPHGKSVNSAKDASDPFELLSAVTRKFLLSIDISTAREFLSTRTTDIAEKFVRFREREGMPELKGLGSIASVSGWKANCRKFAKAMGLDDVAELEPADKFQVKAEVEPKDRIQNDHNVEEEKKSDDELPFTHQRKVFSVQGGDFPLQFRFDLSVRKSDNKQQETPDIFVTYKGASPKSVQEEPGALGLVRLLVNGNFETLPILKDATVTRSNDRTIDTRAPFQFNKAGGGLIDLQNYGVRPLPSQDLAGFQDSVRAYVLSGEGELPELSAAMNKSNIIVNRTGVDSCQFLLRVTPTLEAGQTAPLVFPTATSLLTSKRFQESEFFSLQTLLDSLCVLSRSDLRALFSYLVKDILPETKTKYENAIKNSQDGGDMESLKSACGARFRLYNFSLRIVGLIGEKLLYRSERKTRATLYFGVQFEFQKGEVAPKAMDTIKSAISKEIRDAIYFMLELDDLCGRFQRMGWCTMAVDFLEEVVAEVAACQDEYVSNVHAALEARYKLVSKLDVSPLEAQKWMFSVSPLSPGGTGEKKNVFVCKGENGSVANGALEPDVIAVDENDLKEDFGRISVEWYRSFLAQIVCKVIQACGFIERNFPGGQLIEKYTSLSSDPCEIKYTIMMQRTDKFAAINESSSAETNQPPSNHFFLGIMWPTLREFGWRVNVTGFPSQVTYVAPRWRGEKQKTGKLAKLAKQHRDRRRAQLARDANQAGFGPLPKLTKRLFIATRPSNMNDVKTKKVTVSTIAESFKKQLKSDMGDLPFAKQASSIIEFVLVCFDEQAPALYKDKIPEDSDPDKRPRDLCGPELFMQFLLVMPVLLSQAGLEKQEMSDSLQVIQDLTAFMTWSADKLFHPEIVPPPEQYTISEKQNSSNLARRMKSTGTGNSGGPRELFNVIWDEDKKVLSDFVVSVMEQVVACRATDEDTKRKHRKVAVGYPGAMCRHCIGKKGEGRYFFTTIESLTTLGTVFEKHLVKCPNVPPAIKKAIVSNKSHHHEQRKHLPSGSQQAYFLRLWDRMRNMRIGGEDSSMIQMTHMTRGEKPTTEGEVLEASDEKIEFKDPLDVLDYVRTTAPWKGTKDIDDALGQYYNCIDFGGRIYNTRGMPRNFSPTWLLAKVGPKQKKLTRRNLPG